MKLSEFQKQHIFAFIRVFGGFSPLGCQKKKIPGFGIAPFYFYICVYIHRYMYMTHKYIYIRMCMYTCVCIFMYFPPMEMSLDVSRCSRKLSDWCVALCFEQFCQPVLASEEMVGWAPAITRTWRWSFKMVFPASSVYTWSCEILGCLCNSTASRGTFV